MREQLLVERARDLREEIGSSRPASAARRSSATCASNAPLVRKREDIREDVVLEVHQDVRWPA